MRTRGSYCAVARSRCGSEATSMFFGGSEMSESYCFASPLNAHTAGPSASPVKFSGQPLLSASPDSLSGQILRSTLSGQLLWTVSPVSLCGSTLWLASLVTLTPRTSARRKGTVIEPVAIDLSRAYRGCHAPSGGPLSIHCHRGLGVTSTPTGVSTHRVLARASPTVS